MNYLLFAVWLEHDQLDGYIDETCVMTEDEFGGKSFNCAVCQKVARSKQDITRHIESNHVLTTPFICDLCSSQHKTRRELTRHQKQHKDNAI